MVNRCGAVVKPLRAAGEKAAQGCGDVSAVAETVLQGCAEVSALAERALQGCGKVSALAETVLQGCGEVSALADGLAQGCDGFFQGKMGLIDRNRGNYFAGIMINSPRLTAYRTGEFTQFFRNGIAIVNDNAAPALDVAPQVAALETQVGLLEDDFKTEQASTITETLEQLDDRRDRAWNGISAQVRSFLNHFETAKVDAAKLLLGNLENYGPAIARLRYQLETGTLNNILDDWEGQAPLSAAVTTLGITDWVAELRTANTQFDAAYVQRTQETAGPASQVLALRGTVTEAWNTLKDHITAHATLTPSAAYTQVIDELNNLITQYNEQTASNPPQPDGSSSSSSSSGSSSSSSTVPSSSSSAGGGSSSSASSGSSA